MNSPHRRASLYNLEAAPPPKTNHAFVDFEGPLKLSLMPTEILRMIGQCLPPSARAALALTCKGFWNALIVPFTPEKARKLWQAKIVKPRLYKLGLGWPVEPRSDSQGSRRTKLQLCQPERWDFKRLLEKDLLDEWLLCFDCFILHPAHKFVKVEISPLRR